MHNKMLAALLFGSMLSNPAKAMMFASPSTLGMATVDTGFVQKANYYRHHRHYYGYYRPYYGLYGYYPYGWHRRWWW